MSRFVHVFRPLMAFLMLAGLVLAGVGVGAVGADASAPVPAPAGAAGSQWGLTPGHGPAAGGTAVTLTPPVAGIPDHFTQVSAGETHSVAIGSDGNLYTWGFDYLNRTSAVLGRDTSITPYNRPGMVPKPAGVSKWIQVSAGYSYSAAIGSDGNLYTWGGNQYGQLGRDIGSAGWDATPGMVARPAGVDKWIQISAGDTQSMALGSDGNLYTWGGNYWDSDYGILGRDTSTIPFDRPGMVTKPVGVTSWTQVSAGGNQSRAIGSDGNLYTWGGNLGRDTSIIPSGRPGMVAKPVGVTSWTQVSAGDSHSMALGSDGNLYTWGDNNYGQLGRDTGSTDWDATPGMVARPDGVDRWTQVSAGDIHSMAVGSDGNLYTWGCDKTLQLGHKTSNGNTHDEKLGVVARPDGVDRWTQISGGEWHSMAVCSDGNLYTWGDDADGQLGRDIGGVGAVMKPGRVVFPESRVVLTGVGFDGVAGTGLTARADGTWSVTAPAHAAGTVTVSVSWTLNGVAQPDAHLSYTYEAAPVAVRTVAFDSAGGSAVPSQRVRDGDRAVRPADPTRDGYRFDGWFDGTVAYDFDRPVTGDLTLTAHWTRNAGREPGNPTQGTATSPAQRPAGPSGGQDHSGVLSKTGSDTAGILAVGILTLAAGILTLAGVGKAVRRS